MYIYYVPHSTAIVAEIPAFRGYTLKRPESEDIVVTRIFRPVAGAKFRREEVPCGSPGIDPQWSWVEWEWFNLDHFMEKPMVYIMVFIYIYNIYIY